MLKNFIKTKFAILLFVAKFLWKTKKTPMCQEKSQIPVARGHNFMPKFHVFSVLVNFKKLKTLFLILSGKFSRSRLVTSGIGYQFTGHIIISSGVQFENVSKPDEWFQGHSRSIKIKISKKRPFEHYVLKNISLWTQACFEKIICCFLYLYFFNFAL